MKNKALKFKGQMKEAWDYLKLSKKYIYVILVAFVLSVIIGFVFPERFEIFDKLFSELAQEARGLNWIEMIFFILQNNIVACFFGLLFGVVFGIFPLYSIIFNGLGIGYILNKVFQVSGMSDFWMLFPHGIFELPAVFISMGMGLRLGLLLLKGREEFKSGFYKSINSFLMIVLPLLILAAIIEGTLMALYK
jgi:stage II sporulation protein M